MRRILVLLSFLITFGLSAAGVINVSPVAPKVAAPVSFNVTGIPAGVATVTWYFGDDSLVVGTRTASHTYAEPGKYRVRATYFWDGNFTVERWIIVDPAYQTGPSAPLNLTTLILRWKDGKSITSVAKGFEGLVAYADIKFEGTGPFQAQWLVDGQVLKTVSQTLSFAGRTTIDSGTMPALYTNIPGPHDVTLRILSPGTNFRIPVIRYEVSPVAPPAAPPMVESVYPPTVYSGEEVEVQVTGQNLTEDMKLDFGPGITPVGPVTVMSPMSAKVKVFVPPTTKLGFHSLSMLKGKDRLASKARLEVRARSGGQKSMSGGMPCPDEQSFQKDLVTLEAPSWHGGADTGKDGKNAEQPPPLLTDFTVFEWSEPVKGAAEYFELRIYDKTGKNRILTQKLPGGTKAWNVTADFVPKLVNLVKGGGGGAATFSAKSTIPGLSAPSGSTSATKTLASAPFKQMVPLSKSSPMIKPGLTTAASAAAEKAVQDAQQKAQKDAAHAAHLAEIADVLWQIVGIREYTCLPKPEPESGIRPEAGQQPGRTGMTLQVPASPGQPGQVEQKGNPLQGQTKTPGADSPKPTKLALEVEVSEFWPLKLPDQAKGISLGSCDMVAQGGSISAQCIEGSQGGKAYPDDRFVVSGTFTLKGSPYGFKPAAVDKEKLPPGSNRWPNVMGCSFDNVFLDWGDGTNLVPLSPRLKTPDISFSSDDLFELIDAEATESNGRMHRYKKDGSYNVRVFMLSEDDVQLAGLKSDASKAMANKKLDGTAFDRLLKTAIEVPKGSTSPVPSFVQLGGAQVSTSAVASALQGMNQPSVQQILSRAYVIYCKTVDVRPFDDPCALKPLELVSLDLSFDQPKVSTSSTKTLKAAPNKVLAPAPGAKPPASPGVQINLSSQGPLSMNAGAAQPGLSTAAVKVDAVTSTCNEAFTVQTKLRYHGKGYVKVIWKVDGEKVHESETEFADTIARTGLTKEQSQDKDCSKVTPAEKTFNLPGYLPVVTAGIHFLTAEAVVQPNPPGKINLEQTAIDLEALAAGRKDKVTIATIALLGDDKKTPPKVGVLNPSLASGLPHAIYLNEVTPALSKVQTVSGPGIGKFGLDLEAFKKPPFRVEAGQKVYRVEQADPAEACSIDFPTKGGAFRVTNLYKNVKTEVVGGITRMTGNGIMKVAIRKTEDATDERLGIPVSLEQWEIDGTQVVKGDVNLPNLKQPVELPGTTGTLNSLKGKILGKGKVEDMMASLTLQPRDSSLTLRGDESLRPIWKAERPLSAEGDFYADKLSLPETFLGSTPWIMSSTDGVVLDYSRKEGEGPAGQGNSWVGVRLKKLALKPFDFGLVAVSAPLPLVDTWFLGNDNGVAGLHGVVDFKNWEGKFQDGSIKVGTMHFEALGGGNYSANYKATEVRVPWFPSPLKGDIALTKTPDGFIWIYKNVNQQGQDFPAVVNGGFSLKPANLYFANEKNIAWTVKGDAILDFKADGRPFASFTLDRFCYRFDGRASFEQNLRSKTLPLNKKTTLGDTQADIKSVDISMPTSGSSVVDFAFNTTLRLSDSPLLPAADTQVNYRLNQSGAAYSAPPAATAPFELALAFPMGSPTVNGKIHPVYAPGTGGGASTRYTGEVDLGMFGGPPFKTQFVLGYKGNKDYFLCRADIPLGPTGQVLVPELLTLYKIHGGLGYNFGIDAIEGTMGILDAQPDMKGNAIFSAGMRVGSSDGFVYMLDGTMTISTAAAARMKYDAWLLTHDHSGKGQFEGWIQYGSGSFDGKMWGGLNMLGGLVQFSLGNSEADAAVDMHLGSDSWHIYAGQRNGARIKAKVITSESDSYLMLGSQEGLAIGGAQQYNLEVSAGGVASAYARAYMDMGLQVTPQPKIIGDFSAGMEAGVCVKGVCVSGGVNAAVHAEALPLDVRATANLDLPWPLDDVTFSVHM